MGIDNLDKAKISYTHQEKIKSFFNQHVKGNLNIDHFSINVFFGEKQSLFFSPTPQMAEDLCLHDFIEEDSNYSSEVFKNFSLYPWRSVLKSETDRVINFVKEEKYGMHNGMMIVRDLGGGKYVMYSFATHKRDHHDFPGQFYFLFHCKANYIAQMGDFMYENLLPIINEYTEKEGVYMPPMRSISAIDLKHNLKDEIQHEMFEKISQGRKPNLPKIIKTSNGTLLKLINGGTVKSINTRL